MYYCTKDEAIFFPIVQFIDSILKAEQHYLTDYNFDVKQTKLIHSDEWILIVQDLENIYSANTLKVVNLIDCHACHLLHYECVHYNIYKVDIEIHLTIYQLLGAQ